MQYKIYISDHRKYFGQKIQIKPSQTFRLSFNFKKNLSAFSKNKSPENNVNTNVKC